MPDYQLPAPLARIVDAFKSEDIREQASLIPELSTLTALLQAELVDLESVAGRRRASELALHIARLKGAWAQTLESQGELFSVAQMSAFVAAVGSLMSQILLAHLPEETAHGIIDEFLSKASECKAALQRSETQQPKQLTYQPTENDE